MESDQGPSVTTAMFLIPDKKMKVVLLAASVPNEINCVRYQKRYVVNA